MEKSVLLVSMLATAIFSGSAQSDDEPKKGRFTFQKYVKTVPDHYFNVRVQLAASPLEPSPGGIGVNVYWKVKGIDPNKGRQYLSAFTQGNLPLCPFFDRGEAANCRTNSDFGGSSEHLEGLIWTEIPVSKNGSDVTVPNWYQRHTRFFHYRYTKRDENAIPVTDGNSDQDLGVQLSTVYFTQSKSDCTTTLCGGYGMIGGDKSAIIPLYIPSNNLEFLVIETMVFQYKDKIMQRKDVFYDKAVLAVKYVPTGDGKKMKVLLSSKDYAPEYNMDMYSAFRNHGDGSWDDEDSNIHDNAEDKSGDTIVDFYNIDTIDVTLKYNDVKPSYSNPRVSGIGITIQKKDIPCDPFSSTCSYPTQY